MAEVSINIGANTSEATAAVNELNNALGQTGAEVKKVENSSEDLSKSLEKQEARIKVIDGAINILGGSVELATGAIVGLGLASEEDAKSFEAAALGAIAFADGAKRTFDGVKTLTEGLKAYGGIAGAAQKAQAALNAIILANPYIAAGVAIAALTAAVFLYVNSLDDAADAERKLNAERAKNLGFDADYADLQTRIARARGDDAVAIKKQEIATRELRIEQLEASIEAEEDGKKRIELLKERRKLTQDQKVAVVELATAEKQAADEAAKAAKEAAEKRKAAIEKRRAEAKASEELYLQKLEQLQDNITDVEITTAEQRLEIDRDRTIREINLLKITEKQKVTLRLKAEEEYQAKLAKLKEDKIKEAAIKEFVLQANASKATADRLLEIQALQAETIQEQRDAQLTALDVQFQREKEAAIKNKEDLEVLEKLYAARKQAIIDQANADEVASAQATADALLQARTVLLSNIGAIAGGLSELFKEGSNAAKVAAIAEIAIGTAVGFIQALDIAQKSAKATGPGAAFAFPIFYASQIAAVLGAAAQARRIIQSVPGTGGLPSVTAPSSTGGGSFSIPGGSGIPGGGGGLPGLGGGRVEGAPTIGTIAEGPVRAYVLASDVSNGVQANIALNNRRRLAG